MDDPAHSGRETMKTDDALALLAAFVGRNDCSPSSPVIEVLCSLPLSGVWKSELASGLLFWSPAVFDIYGFEMAEGPINFSRGMASYHPEDREPLFEMIDRATRDRHGFSFNLRIKPGDATDDDDGWIFLRTEAQFHVNEQGLDEIYGSVGVSGSDERFIRTA
jgi:hypothetical protein